MQKNGIYYLLTFYFWSKFFINPLRFEVELDGGKRGVTLTEAHIDLHWAISSEKKTEGIYRSLQKPFVLFWKSKKERVRFFSSFKIYFYFLSFTQYEVICLLTYPIYFLLFPQFFKRDSSREERRFSLPLTLFHFSNRFCWFSNKGSQLFCFTELVLLFRLHNTCSPTGSNLLKSIHRIKIKWKLKHD